MKNKMSIIISVALGIYLMSYIICNFLGETGRTIVAHGTGIITLINALLGGIFSLYMVFKNNASKYIFMISCFAMALAYFMYLFLHIEPSNYYQIAHAAISMLYDVSTSGLILAMVVDKLSDHERCS